MKRPAQPSCLQLNLPLLNTPATAIPEGKQKELILALVELLISGFQESVESPATGGGNEPEAYD